MSQKLNKESKRLAVADIVGFLNQKAPFDWAEDWDNVGFLLGSSTDMLTGVIVAINLGPEAIQQACQQKANLIICHHPPIFKPLNKITQQNTPWVYEALQHNINVIVLHTNYDLASSEASAEICRQLDLAPPIGFLASRNSEVLPASLNLAKFITYLPTEQRLIDDFRQALAEVGAGVIGNYQQCSFSWSGEGTFFGNEQSNPQAGSRQKLEKVAETRFEMIFPLKKVDKIVTTARKAHPYDEMAFDIVKLEQAKQSIGYGFIAKPLQKPLTLKSLLNKLKEVFQLPSLTVVNPGGVVSEAFLNQSLTKVGFSQGSGSGFIGAAAAKGVSVYICGEVGFHQMLEARNKGLPLVILGHSYSEHFFMATVSGWVREFFTGADGHSVVSVYEPIHENY